MPIKFGVRIVQLKVYIWPLPDRWPWPSFKVTSASQTWQLFNLQYLGQYLSYYIQMWHGSRLMHGLELDLDFEHICKTCPTCLFLLTSNYRLPLWLQHQCVFWWREQVLQPQLHRRLHGDHKGWEKGTEMYSLLQCHVPGQMPSALPPYNLHGEYMHNLLWVNEWPLQWRDWLPVCKVCFSSRQSFIKIKRSAPKHCILIYNDREADVFNYTIVHF